MMPAIPPGTAVVCGGSKLLFEQSVSARERATVLLDRDAALRRLRASQINAAGFFVTLPFAIVSELRAASWVAIDMRTTALSRHSVPLRLRKTSLIGNVTWQEYRHQHPGVRLSTKPRPRVISFYTDLLGTCAFDLDALPDADRLALFDVLLDGKTVIGFNLAKAFSWMFGEVSARPSLALDPMLLIRQSRPATLVRPYRWAAFNDPEKKARATELLDRHKRRNASLDFLAACADLPESDAAHREPAAWCVTKLSRDHLAGVTTDLATALELVRFAQPECLLADAPAYLRGHAPWYLPYQSALIRLAEAHVLGIAFDEEAAQELSCRLQGEVETLAEDLLCHPGLDQVRADLKDPHVGETAAVKRALAALQEASPAATFPNPGLEPSAASPACSTPRTPQALYVELCSAKRSLRTVESYSETARADGRLHSLFQFDTATGRTTSRSPAMQNLPATDEFRSLIEARPGHLILSVDYTAMELYIAAALADRAVKEVKAIIGDDEQEWWIRMLRAGARHSDPLFRPSESSADTGTNLTRAAAELRWLGRTVLRRRRQSMVTVLERGLDPHLVTAADLARRAGRCTFEGHPVKWVGSLNVQDSERLGMALADDRRGAKAANFGLLYGMSAPGLHRSGSRNYGLKWTIEEAASARGAWFELFPEFALWHRWTKYRESSEDSATRWRKWGSGSQESTLITPKFDVRLYRTSTLAGRPLAILDDFKAALSYQAQGTGADILAKAITDLPSEIADKLLMPVHDELVFEVPEAEAEAIKTVVERVMVSAADGVLQLGFPIKVKSSIGPTWT